jgi:hypothetical protein
MTSRSKTRKFSLTDPKAPCSCLPLSISPFHDAQPNRQLVKQRTEKVPYRCHDFEKLGEITREGTSRPLQILPKHLFSTATIDGRGRSSARLSVLGV